MFLKSLIKIFCCCCPRESNVVKPIVFNVNSSSVDEPKPMIKIIDSTGPPRFVNEIHITDLTNIEEATLILKWKIKK